MGTSTETQLGEILNHPGFGGLAGFLRAGDDAQRDALARRIAHDFEAGGQLRYDLVTGAAYRFKPSQATTLPGYVQFLVDQATPQFQSAFAAVRDDPRLPELAQSTFYDEVEEDRATLLAISIAADFCAGGEVLFDEDAQGPQAPVRRMPLGVSTVGEFLGHQLNRATAGGHAVKLLQKATLESARPPAPEQPEGFAVPENLESINLTWDQAAGRPETAVPLEQLPPNLIFPDNFAEPIRYDPQRKLLTYRGFMTSMSYRFLRKLSDDLKYIEALDELSVRSSFALQPSAAARRWPWLVVLVIAAALAGTALLLRYWLR